MSQNSLKMPDHFPELLTILSKEVIRSQPSEMVPFIADIFDKMVQLKAGELNMDNCNEPWVKDFMDNFLGKLKNE